MVTFILPKAREQKVFMSSSVGTCVVTLCFHFSQSPQRRARCFILLDRGIQKINQLLVRIVLYIHSANNKIDSDDVVCIDVSVPLF